MIEPREVVTFWREAGPERWFSHDERFDQTFRERFEAAHLAAARRDLEDWVTTPDGALALVILLDQFPRNCFRGTAHAYATDCVALHYARRALERGLDAQVDPLLRFFLYMPFEHSESLEDQERAVTLIEGVSHELLQYALAHRDVIRRFGRFPHRNRELCRDNTPEEQAYLDAGGGFVTKKSPEKESP